MVVLIERAANHGGAAVGGQSDGDTLPTTDAASLAAVTPVLLSDQASINEATTLFNSQASLVKGIGTVTLTVTTSDHALTRTVNVTYQTTSSTLFGGFTGKSSIAIAGMSQSQRFRPTSTSISCSITRLRWRSLRPPMESSVAFRVTDCE
jgi:hypothetical protein